MNFDLLYENVLFAVTATFLNPINELMWIRNLLLFEIVLWIANYVLDLSQLPRLLRWDIKDDISRT